MGTPTNNNDSEQIILTTKHGHEVVARVSGGEKPQVTEAKVINNVTGSIRPLDTETGLLLSDSLRAAQLSDRIAQEVREIGETIKGYGERVNALGPASPILAPHYKALDFTQNLMTDFQRQATHFKDQVLHRADKLAEGEQPRHGVDLPHTGKGPRTIG